MFESYFFIPANKKRFITKLPEIKADHFIFDLEDAVAPAHVLDAFANLAEVVDKTPHYLRVRLIEDDRFSAIMLERALALGFIKFVIPKLYSEKHFADLQKAIALSGKSVRLMVLVEHPQLLMNLVERLSNVEGWVDGVALGAQDYCSFMGMSYSPNNYSFAQHLLLNTAKSIGLKCIDTASMNLTQEQDFRSECFNAFHMGFDGKLVIHPWQLQLLKSTAYYSENEVTTARELIIYAMTKGDENFDVVQIDGKLYERPHLLWAKKVVRWADEYNH